MVPNLYTDVVLFVFSFFSEHGPARVCEPATWSQASLAETVETGDKNGHVTSAMHFL